MSLKTAIIGAGSHSRHHFDMLDTEPRMDLVAVVDLDQSRLDRAKSEHGVATLYTDYQKMLDEIDPDIVYVVTFPGPLTDIVCDCLSAGIHTSVEKPPGVTSADTRRMRDAEKASSAKAIVSLNRRYIPEVLAIRKMLTDRGGPVHVAATYNKPQMRGQIRETGHLISLDAIHHVDLLRWLAGDVSEVFAEAWAAPSHPSEMRHNAVVRFENGCRGIMMSHYAVGYRIQRFEAHAQDFSAYVDLTNGVSAELYVEGATMEGDLDLEAVGGSDFNETRHFADCILNDVEPWSTLSDAVKTMELCEAIEASHKGPLQHQE